MPNPPMQPPTLSLAERDRRWANVRKLMRERGFDGLLVAGFRSREMYETYIGGTVIVTATGCEERIPTTVTHKQ